MRDSEGRLLPQATSVQVWRTKDNKILSFDVLAGGLKVDEGHGGGGGRRPPGDGGGYNKLTEEDSPVVQSNFNSREDSHKDKDTWKEEDKQPKDAGGVSTIVLRRSGSPPPPPKAIEELDVSGLSPAVLRRGNNSRVYRVLDDLDSLGGSGRNLRILRLPPAPRLSDRREYGGDGSRVEIIRLGPSDRQQLNYSRHYGLQEGVHGGLAHVIEVEEANPWYQFDPYNRYIYRQRARGGGGDSHRNADDGGGSHRRHKDHHRGDGDRRHRRSYHDDKEDFSGHGQDDGFEKRHHRRHSPPLSGDGRDRRRHQSPEQKHPVQVKFFFLAEQNLLGSFPGKIPDVFVMESLRKRKKTSLILFL